MLVRPGRERLSGPVEVDEAYIGGEEPGLPGGRVRGKKVLVGVAVEVRDPQGMGRCRIAPLTDASGASLRQFVTDHVEPGATIITDGWRGYSGLTELGYTLAHDRRSQRAARSRGDPNLLLSSVDQGLSPAHWWLLGTPTGRWSQPTWRATSTSSCSDSTVGTRGARGQCSSEPSNSPWPTSPSATTT